MSASPASGERPPLQGIRRSFTTPARQLSFHEKAGLEKSDAGADVLYTHPTARIVSFSPPKESIKSTTKAEIPADTDYPIDTVETLPWRSRTETLAATGVMVIEKVRGSTNFLKCQDVMHAILRNSQCWCVDGESKFVLRVRKLQYYRIELPSTTDADKAKVEELKRVFPTVLRFERTPCPFIRAFQVDLPDDAITPRRKGQWKRRDSSQPNVSDTETPPSARTKPTRGWSMKAPPTSYPRNGPGYMSEIERGRPGSSAGSHKGTTGLGAHRNSSPASYAPSEDGTDSEPQYSEHESERESTTDRSETASPEKSAVDAPNHDDKDNGEDMSNPEASRPLSLGTRVSPVNHVSDEVDEKITTRVPVAPQHQILAKKESTDDSNTDERRAFTSGSNLQMPGTASTVEAVAAGRLFPQSDSDLSASDASYSDNEEHGEGHDFGEVQKVTGNQGPDLPLANTIDSNKAASPEPPAANDRPIEESVSESDESEHSSSKSDTSTHSQGRSEQDVVAHAGHVSGTTPNEANSDKASSRKLQMEPIQYSATSGNEDEVNQLAEEEKEPMQAMSIDKTVFSELEPVHPAPLSDMSERESLLKRVPSSEVHLRADEIEDQLTPMAASVNGDQDGDTNLDKTKIEAIEDEDDDNLSTVSSMDSFHTLASTLHLASMDEDAEEYESSILGYRYPFGHPSIQHKRELSEMTITASSLADVTASDHMGLPAQAQDLPQKQSLLRSLEDNSTGPQPISPPTESQESDGLRQRLRARRSFSPLPPASTLFTGNQIRHDSGSGHMTKAILQKAVVKPIEVVVLVFHILARIAGGATVSDLLSGELFRRPEHQRKVSGFADRLIGIGHSNSDTEDDYGVPIRGRRKSVERRFAAVFDEANEDASEDVD